MSNEAFAERLQATFENIKANNESFKKSDLAKQVKISQPYLNKIFKGEYKYLPPADIVLRIAKALNISYEWLITGRGQKEDANSPYLKDSILVSTSKVYLEKNPLFGTYTTKVEFKDTFTNYSLVDKSILKRHNISVKDCKKIHITDDGMKPLISPDDFIIIDSSINTYEQLISNRIYAFFLDNNIYCRYVIKMLGGDVLLRAINTNYVEEKFSRTEILERFNFIGMAIQEDGILI